MRRIKVDKQFLLAISILAVGGFFIFCSASLGLLTKNGASFGTVALKQAFWGLFAGSIGLFITSRIHYTKWKKLAFYLFIVAIAVNLLVFVPKIGLSHGGASRWILLGPLSFQPSELLKIGFIIYFAAWLSHVRERVKTFKYGLLPFLILSAVVGAVLISQPDIDTLVVVLVSGMAMFISAGARWRHIFSYILIGTICLTMVAFAKPYAMQRITTFLNPDASNPQGSGYQIKQSLIAIGSGGMNGRGFGQSIQKFYYLPEPIGDSIFAVAAEEFGFIGSSLILLLFMFFTWRGLKIAIKAPDMFGGLLVIGIVILVITQSFINIAAILGIIPLSGIPLLFVSQGGSALCITLAEMGIILNVSKYRKR